MPQTARWWVERASWFLASELVRRHPACSVVQVRSAGGQSDLIWVGGWTGNPSAPVFQQRWAIDRKGSGGVHVGREMRQVTNEAWAELLSGEPAAFIGRLEVAAGFAVSTSIRPPNARTLTYQVIEQILGLTALSGHRVTCRSLVVDEAGTGRMDAPPEYHGVIAGLMPSSQAPAEAYRFWVLEQGGMTIALLHDSGHAWVGTTHHDLGFLHGQVGRVQPLVMQLFAAYLS